MFTGLIEAVGILRGKVDQRGNTLLTIESTLIRDDLKAGDSVAVSGPCLTVTKLLPAGFQVEATQHTVQHSTIQSWSVGRQLNLERALKVSDRLGGHIVQGHVDGLGQVSRMSYGVGATDIFIKTDPATLRLIAPKGSITVDGVSLTIASKLPWGFQLMVVPFTLEHTTLGDLKPGQKVNLETDLIIRWLADRFADGELTDPPESWLTGFGQIHTED